MLKRSLLEKQIKTWTKRSTEAAENSESPVNRKEQEETFTFSRNGNVKITNGQ
jgi:hypothetical protein